MLVAEDDYAWRVSIVRLLESIGLECVAVPDGRAAADLLADASQHFDLAVTDFRMPRGSGWTVIEAVRTHRGAAFPVIMQTAESQYSDVHERAGALGIPLVAKADVAALLLPMVRDALGMT